ncbi:glycosyltransferase [Membranihabitans marinus]|uniref:glycosyltransferase n=1 Tax=Membranihabitans marinus TaxID=1227546 RepID=UPI001F167140|nr:glycosyltransferase family 2 protein [Membranihabitans marinus]
MNYNSYGDTIRLYTNLSKYQSIPEHCFYIVDNHCDDGPKLQKYFKNTAVHLIHSPHNGGYAFGNNLAIREAIRDNKDYYLILNPDIQINSETIIQMLQFMANDKSIGALGCRIMEDKNTIYSDGGRVDFQKSCKPGHLNGGKRIDEVVSVSIVDQQSIQYINGSVLLTRKEVLDEIGLMREDFFLYFEETEWCIRMTKNTHYKLVVMTDQQAYHKRSQKNELYTYYMNRNRVILCRLLSVSYGHILLGHVLNIGKILIRRDYTLKRYIAASRGVMNGITQVIK